MSSDWSSNSKFKKIILSAHQKSFPMAFRQSEPTSRSLCWIKIITQPLPQNHITLHGNLGSHKDLILLFRVLVVLGNTSGTYFSTTSNVCSCTSLSPFKLLQALLLLISGATTFFFCLCVHFATWVAYSLSISWPSSPPPIICSRHCTHTTRTHKT